MKKDMVIKSSPSLTDNHSSLPCAGVENNMQIVLSRYHNSQSGLAQLTALSPSLYILSSFPCGFLSNLAPHFTTTATVTDGEIGEKLETCYQSQDADFDL